MPGPVFLKGETINLRTIEEEDLPFLQEAINTPGVWRGTGISAPKNMEQERDFFEECVCSDTSVDLLVTIDPETPVGSISFTRIDKRGDWAELGCWITPEHQGNGYATAATRRLIEFGFQQRGYHRIQARVTDFNDPSRRVVESLGFSHEGTLREASFVDGEYRDTCWYGLLRSEWEEDATTADE